MLGVTAIQSRYTPFSPKNSEEFNSASRSVKPGLIASGIVSAWTWAATLVCPFFNFGMPSHLIFYFSFKAVRWRINLVLVVLGGTAVRTFYLLSPRFLDLCAVLLAGATVQILLFAMVSLCRTFGTADADWDPAGR